VKLNNLKQLNILNWDSNQNWETLNTIDYSLLKL